MPSNTYTHSAKKGSAVIIWDKNDKGEIGVLVGKESVYLTDIVLEGGVIEDLQRYYLTEMDATSIEGEPILTTVKKHFMKIALNLSAKYNMEVRYDVPELVGGEGVVVDGVTPYYHVNFRCLPLFENVRKGVIKGGREISDANELETVLREIREELGLDIKPKYIHSLGEGRHYDLFSLPLHEIGDRRAVSAIMDRIAQRKNGHSGEVFDLKFVNFTHIPDLSPYNVTSREIIQRLFQNISQ
jgi:8-oxo-dGTP pyrophosphatase MutT (NUDIX family)